MGLRVNSNIASLNAQRSLSVTTERLQANFRRLSTGLRISTAADDAAGLAIAERDPEALKDELLSKLPPRQRGLRLFIEHVAHALVEQERKDELLVIAGINRPAQERGRAPEIGFELLLGDAGHWRSYAPTVHTRKSQSRLG